MQQQTQIYWCIKINIVSIGDSLTDNHHYELK